MLHWLGRVGRLQDGLAPELPGLPLWLGRRCLRSCGWGCCSIASLVYEEQAAVCRLLNRLSWLACPLCVLLERMLDLHRESSSRYLVCPVRQPRTPRKVHTSCVSTLRRHAFLPFLDVLGSTIGALLALPDHTVCSRQTELLTASPGVVYSSAAEPLGVFHRLSRWCSCASSAVSQEVCCLLGLRPCAQDLDQQLAATPDRSPSTMGNQTSVLHDAAAKNNTGMVRRLLDQERMDPNARDKVRVLCEQPALVDLRPSVADLGALADSQLLDGSITESAEPMLVAESMLLAGRVGATALCRIWRLCRHGQRAAVQRSQDDCQRQGADCAGWRRYLVHACRQQAST